MGNAGFELRSGLDVNRHDVVVRRAVVEFFSVAPPAHLSAARGRDRDFLVPGGERPHVYLKSPGDGSIGSVGHPFTVVGELRLALLVLPLHNREGLLVRRWFAI